MSKLILHKALWNHSVSAWMFFARPRQQGWLTAELSGLSLKNGENHDSVFLL